MSVAWGSELKSYFLRRSGSLFEILADLVEINTVNPPGQEHRLAEWVAHYAAERNIHAEIYPVRSGKNHADPGRSNVLLEVGRGKPRLTLLCPLDTLLLAETWKSDPLQLGFHRNRVMGLGVQQGKGHLAALLHLMTFLKKHEAQLRGKVRLIGLADGERSHVGLCIALAEKMVEGDLAILAGGGVGPDTIQTSERGQISLKIICPGDATRPEVPGAQRALHNLINFLPMLMCLEPIGSEAGSLLSIEIRSVTTEGAKEALPRQAVAEIDIFYQPSVEYFAILEEIHRFRSAYRCKELRIEMTHHKPAAKAPYLPGEVEALRRAVQVVRKKEPIFGGSILPLGLAGLVEEKIPAIGYGYNSAAAAYLPDETVEMNLLSEYSLTLALGILNMQGLYKSEDFDQAEEIPITTAIQPVRSPEKPMPQTLSLEESIMANITAALPSSRPEPAAKVQLLQDQDLFSPQSSEPEPVSSIKIHPLTSHPAAKIEPSIDPLTLSTELRNQVKLQRGQKSRPGQDTKTPSLFEPEQFELGFRSLDNTEPATAASSEPGKQPPPATTKPPQGYKPLDITLGDDQPDTKTLLNLDGSEENSNGELFPGGSSLYSRHPNRHPNPYRGKI